MCLSLSLSPECSVDIASTCEIRLSAESYRASTQLEEQNIHRTLALVKDAVVEYRTFRRRTAFSRSLQRIRYVRRNTTRQ